MSSTTGASISLIVSRENIHANPNTVMKYLILILSLTITTSAFAQTVQSSCEADEVVTESLKKEVDQIVYYYNLKEKQPGLDSVPLSSTIKGAFLDAMIAVHNAESLSVHDTIFDVHRIIPHHELDLTRILILVEDTTSVLYTKLKNQEFPTGNNRFDSLSARYPLSINVEESNWIKGYVILQFDRTYNVMQMAKEFLELDAITYTELHPLDGDGDRIDGSIDGSDTYLTYSKGYGACPSGCIHRQYWGFKIDASCRVTYQGTWGDIINGLFDNERSAITIYPNPFTDKIHVEGLDQSTAFEILDMSGKKLIEGITNGHTISGLSYLKQDQAFILKLTVGDTGFQTMIIRSNQ